MLAMNLKRKVIQSKTIRKLLKLNICICNFCNRQNEPNQISFYK